MTISTAITKSEVARCLPVIRQLRTHVSLDEFQHRVSTQRKEGYTLAYLEHRRSVVAVAGYRIGNCLAWGKFLYVDDLVTDESVRSNGYGEHLYAWLVKQARAEGCDQIHLDSGVQRFAAHKFYLAQDMEIRSHHFSAILPKSR